MFFCLGGGKSFLQTMLAVLQGFYKTQELLRPDAPKAGRIQLKIGYQSLGDVLMPILSRLHLKHHDLEVKVKSTLLNNHRLT